VVAPGGQRVRIALGRLSPSRGGGAPPPESQVRILAATPTDVPDQLDVRGMRAQEAREAVRALIDDAALAGLREVQVIHGRGTGALRAAIREELDRHPLVHAREGESAEGATVALLAPREQTAFSS
jgi:DNA mismatch repair protein MutS2